MAGYGAGKSEVSIPSSSGLGLERSFAKGEVKMNVIIVSIPSSSGLGLEPVDLLNEAEERIKQSQSLLHQV